jgi:hypothetical protein
VDRAAINSENFFIAFQKMVVSLVEIEVTYTSVPVPCDDQLVTEMCIAKKKFAAINLHKLCTPDYIFYLSMA